MVSGTDRLRKTRPLSTPSTTWKVTLTPVPDGVRGLSMSIPFPHPGVLCSLPAYHMQGAKTGRNCGSCGFRACGPTGECRPASAVHCQAPGGKCQFLRDQPALRQVPKPGELPFGELTAARLDPRHGLGQARTAVKVVKEFLV